MMPQGSAAELRGARGLDETFPGEARFRLSPKDFRAVQTLAKRVFGLDLREGKESLVAARLSKRMRELGIEAVSDYLELVRSDRGGLELAALIDALTTNFTSFLREARHFQLLRELIAPLMKRRDVAIWSAGCSTGEEPYSILFTMLDAAEDASALRLRLLATDISRRVLNAAQLGVYPEGRLHELPGAWRARFFQRGVGAQSGFVRVRPELRDLIRFEHLNLIEPFDSVGRQTVIFCRNVMIYFDKPTQENLVRRFAAQLEPGGYLFIGHSEGLMGLQHGLEYIMPAVYRKRECR
jgi:chemotaxis protein methyltransferase CheR